MKKLNYQHYYPILRIKEAELTAYSEIDSQKKNLITPVFEFPPPSNETADEKKGSPLGTLLSESSRKILKCLGNIRPAFIDFSYIDPCLVTEDGDLPVQWVFDRLRGFGVNGIPITGLDRDESYNEVITDIIQQDNRGVGIRINRGDLSFPNRLSDQIYELAKRLKIPFSDINLFLDFKYVHREDFEFCFQLALETLHSLNNIQDFRGLTIAGSSFPENLGMKSNQVKNIPRADFLLWQKILSESQSLPRIPSYSDYGIQPSKVKNMESKKIPFSNKLRYTLEDKFLVLRGERFKKFKKGQYSHLAGSLCRLSDYKGVGFSWGDKKIQESASNKNLVIKPGRSIAYDMNHHITLVAQQISNFRGY